MILTYTGRLVDPLNLKPPNLEKKFPGDVCLEDIVWSLSWLNRFTGHAHTPVSVLAHSILVAMRLPDRLKVYGLLHDAAEAYLGDINRTVKHALREMAYLEMHAMGVIWQTFGVPIPSVEDLLEVKKADDEALAIEATSFMSPKWRTLVPERVNDNERMFPMTPAETRRAFMALWAEWGPATKSQVRTA